MRSLVSPALSAWCVLLSIAVTGDWSPVTAEPITAPRTAPLALTQAEYNNTVADLLGFPRDGARWPELPAVADRISPRRKAPPVFLDTD